MKRIRRNMTKKLAKKRPYLLFHIAIFVVTCIVIVGIIQWDRMLFKAEFREGDIALRTIYAPYDFSIKGDVNTKATEEARKKAADSVLPIYVFDVEIQSLALKKAESLVNSIDSLKSETALPYEERESKIKEIAASNNVSEALVTEISELKDLQSFFDNVRKTVETFMPKGIISASELLKLKDRSVKSITLINGATDSETVVSPDEYSTIEDLKNEIKGFSSSIRDKKERSAVIDFINSVLAVNVIYDREKTEARKQSIMQRVQSIHNIVEVKRNEKILTKGERIGREHIAKLEGIEEHEPSVMKIGGLFGIAILVGLFILLASLYVHFYNPDVASQNKELVLFSLICILILFVAKLIALSPWPSNLIPVAVASMLIAILISSRLAIVATCFLSILVGMLSGNILDITGVSLVGGTIGVFAMRGVRRRSQVITAGLCVGFANMSYLIGIGLIRALDFHAYITESLFGFANGVMSAVIVTGVLPIFENTFKITTDISLLELADLNHPLLKEMVMKAPGTYHHSLVVGNLAEAACEEIGANALLARVSSYFHDVGKIEKAAYFSENQSLGDATHDKLSPTMSSLIITNHVKNGVEMAKKYKLNKKIIDIIRQHHGTGLVFYFFKRALEKVKDEEVGEQSFRYPGPKPQTREAACVLLADSVEAASRTLDDPTPSRIRGLVRKVINNKFIDGQLDECDLTLRDLEKIAEVFIHILTGIFHTRVEYPEEPEKTGA